ncbi:MAG TPA: hypothetical protein VE136_15145 [Anaerolineales bacterium]|jgi:hypothetical protein|nr:hypothetical protein [Anaerolineales bacterium]
MITKDVNDGQKSRSEKPAYRIERNAGNINNAHYDNDAFYDAKYAVVQNQYNALHQAAQNARLLKAAKKQDQSVREQRKVARKGSRIFDLALRYVRLLGLFGD